MHQEWESWKEAEPTKAVLERSAKRLETLRAQLENPKSPPHETQFVRGQIEAIKWLTDFEDTRKWKSQK